MIKQAKFVVSVADASKVPDYGACEIAIAGKSNVGKNFARAGTYALAQLF